MTEEQRLAKLAQTRAWNARNPGYHKQYVKERRKRDPAYAMARRLRSRLYKLIKGNKAASTMALVGCTSAELVRHLESTMVDGMNWDNRFWWSIDHIVPCALFDLRDPVQQRICFHYSNLQVLWSHDNLRKSNKIIPLDTTLNS